MKMQSLPEVLCVVGNIYSWRAESGCGGHGGRGGCILSFTFACEPAIHSYLIMNQNTTKLNNKPLENYSLWLG